MKGRGRGQEGGKMKGEKQIIEFILFFLNILIFLVLYLKYLYFYIYNI